MPRKVGGRKAVSKRAKPTVPDGDEGKNLTRRQKEEKLKLFLQDFDQEVDSRIQKTQKEAQVLCELMKKIADFELAKLPPAVREMNIDDYLRAGSASKAILWLNTNKTDKNESDNSEFKMPCLTVTTVKSKRSKKVIGVLDSVAEEETTTTNKPVASNRRTTRGRRLSNQPPAQASRRSTRSNRQSNTNRYYQETPYSKLMDTPMITPKFDPRLFQTPGITRLQRKKEKTLRPCISVTGSPVKTDDVCIVFDKNGVCSYVDEFGQPKRIEAQDRDTHEKLLEMQRYITNLVRK
ncbi:borealin-like [Tubulanus polymorphus]|uniref:borealin-like n=1 Tax=Tubulanus polymorphus TaxID=672921 RepID=UPI003DA267BB